MYDETDPSVVKHIEWSERATKTRQGQNTAKDALVRPFKPKLFRNNQRPERCPVRLFLLYEEKKPAEKKKPDDNFYLAVNTNRPRADSKWYKNGNMGEDRIAEIMKKVA